MGIGAVVLGVGAYGAYKGAMTLTWPRAPATITSADLLRQTMQATGGSGQESWNSFHVLYRYRVVDSELVAGGVEPYDFGMQNSAGAARMKARHPVGSISEIAYDPANPAIAYLEPGPSSFALMLSGIGSIIVLGGFWIRRRSARALRAMNEPGAA